MKTKKTLNSRTNTSLTGDNVSFFTLEAYKSARTNIIFAMPGSGCKTVMFTSSIPREGKTTTCLNTAIVFAQAHYRVLVLDCDLRKPRIHKLLRTNNDVGVTDVLVGVKQLDDVIKHDKKLNLDCLVVLGGNGSHKTANLLREKGLNVLTLPKTIDNDLAETEISFGFQSAVDIATNAIDCIHTTAASHSRVFIVELMGHKTGWLTLHAGIAGGADIILIPEIPYSIEAISQAIAKRTASGKRFTIIAAAEGAISKEEAAMSKKELKLLRKQENYASTAYRIGAAIEEKTGQEVRVTVPGHVQRGGQPVAYDRVLATRLGVRAAELILNHEYGYMVGVKDNKIVKISLCDVAGKTKMVDPGNELITQARQLGICLGE